MTFHLLFIELIRVRRAHPLRVVEAFLRELEKREVEQTKRGAFLLLGHTFQGKLGHTNRGEKYNN
jgi:hypothetical protein